MPDGAWPSFLKPCIKTNPGSMASKKKRGREAAFFVWKILLLNKANLHSNTTPLILS